MKKVAINRKFGGFNLSDEAMLMYLKKTFPNSSINVCLNEWNFPTFKVDGKEIYHFEVTAIENRENPILIEVIETLGEKANTPYSKLKVVEIPDDVQYIISDYDGVETVEEVHRTWC